MNIEAAGRCEHRESLAERTHPFSRPAHARRSGRIARGRARRGESDVVQLVRHGVRELPRVNGEIHIQEDRGLAIQIEHEVLPCGRARSLWAGWWEVLINGEASRLPVPAQPSLRLGR